MKIGPEFFFYSYLYFPKYFDSNRKNKLNFMLEHNDFLAEHLIKKQN